MANGTKGQDSGRENTTVSEKTDSKKKLIIDKATEVFAAKGFRSVTMKDIVEACEISRGGLYLYYGSTEEVFKDVVAAQDADESDENVEKLLAEATPSQLLLWFVKEQKKAILRRKNSLVTAKYEYAFSNRESGNTKEAKDAFETAVAVLDNILKRGNESGEFECEDTAMCARNMMYAIEGMKVCAAEFGLSEKKVDNELLFIMQQFMEA